MSMKFGVIGGGSWATALAKILTDKGHAINSWIRNENTINHIRQRRHNPHYLSSGFFDANLPTTSVHIQRVVRDSDTLVIAVPSAFIEKAIEQNKPGDLKNK